MVIAIGIKTSGLHEKLALKICMIIGSEPKRLLLGIMCVTGFISLWISNSTTTSMILPISLSLAKLLVKIHPDFRDEKLSFDPIEYRMSNIDEK